jgi:hypothetical protein
MESWKFGDIPYKGHHIYHGNYYSSTGLPKRLATKYLCYTFQLDRGVREGCKRKPDTLNKGGNMSVRKGEILAADVAKL